MENDFFFLFIKKENQEREQIITAKKKRGRHKTILFIQNILTIEERKLEK